MRFRCIAGLVSATLLAACGSSSDNPKKNPDNKIDGFNLVGGETTASADGLSGEGEIVFNDSVGSIESGKRFEISFTLAADASLSVVTYASKTLSNGVELDFAREGDHLHVEITSGGEIHEISSHFDALATNGAINLAIEVHNDETPAHIVVENMADEAMLFDSEGDHDHDHAHEHDDDHGDEDHEDSDHHDHEDENHEIVHGNGKGNFWGLRLSDGAVVTEARAKSPEAGH